MNGMNLWMVVAGMGLKSILINKINQWSSDVHYIKWQWTKKQYLLGKSEIP